MIATGRANRTAERSSPWWQFGAFGGIAWFILFIIGGVVLQGEPPAFDKPIADTLNFFAGDGTRYLVGDYILALAFWFGFLPFVACFAGLVWRAEGDPPIVTWLLLAGGISTVIVGGIAPIFTNALALNDIASTPGVPEASAQGLMYEHAIAIADLGLPAALLVFAAAWAIWSTNVVWRWIAIIAVLDGILLLLGAAFPIEAKGEGTLFFFRFISFIGLAIWTLLTSFSMFLQGREAS